MNSKDRLTNIYVDFINTCVKTYRSIALHPAIVSATILKENDNSDIIKIFSKWSQRNLEKGEITYFQRQHILAKSNNSVFETFPVDISQEDFYKYSSSEKLYCIIRKIKQENKKKTFLEIWNTKGLFKNFDINAFDIHGDIYCDVKFGSLEWSPNEDKILYIAEKLSKKSEPFYKQKSKNEGSKNYIKSLEDVSLGDEYIYKPDWGEQLIEKHQSIIGMCDIASETLEVVDGIPSHYSPAQVLWSKDGNDIYGVVFENEPRRLGLIYCTNRESYIFCLDSKGEFKILSEPQKSVHSPRLSLDGKSLFWLQRAVGGAHGGCHQLIKMNLVTKEKEVMIDIIKKGDEKFSGLYLQSLPTKDVFQKMGDEYIYKPDWGEQLIEKHQSIIGMCDIASETLEVVDGIPSHYSPAQVLWSKDGNDIYGVVFENEPRRLGLIYCTNRESYIFCLDSKGEFKILSEPQKSVHSPRLSLDGKSLFWLQRAVGGAHGGCHQLIKMNLVTKEGDEYIYKPDWGEQLIEKHQSIIGMCDIASETLEVVDGIPSHYSPAQVLWSKDGNDIYGVVFENEPRRLGLIYCTNRESYIFCLDSKGEFKILSEPQKSVHSPRLSLDGKSLFWLQRAVGGAHGGCHELIKMNLVTKEKEVMIDIIKKGDEKFSGLYLQSLPERCFSKNGLKLFFSSLNRNRIVSYYLDLETKKIHQLNTTDGSSTILDVHNDIILISTANFKKPPSLEFSKSLTDLKWIPVTRSESINDNFMYKELEFQLSENGNENTFNYYNAFYYGPPSSETNKMIPLIVYPHGGPHSAVFNDFSIEFNFFVSLGYGILAVNYRGSTGVGQDGVDFLRGKIGDTDVKDMQNAVHEILRTFSFLDKNNIFLYGKSFGGFLVGQLSGQHPEFYRAVVNVNGVTDVYSMYTMSDIPDWSSAETNLEFDESKPLTLDDVNKMVKVSPIQLIEKIKTPTLFLVGKKDLRVPFYQGVRMYNALKARKVKVRLNMYDGNHTLGGVPVHIDGLINTALWFEENKLK
ncbi:acylamino-acid-releasing enzyme, putative [Pediculus humanus corporis]|uniref:Acylamino-acid-releasing enzyme n=1 Tax=Pediculus humanus subsp. corporis TaxID=121224 RepID=E0V9I9_PEDHC|nr:acylamino-acid-releasing enzyme, putative [Pediculus humanus corporis]EEB10045.1 acylamino-acid-releasing enzyme, putative [Pediculus humanus corporis]